MFPTFYSSRSLRDPVRNPRLKFFATTHSHQNLADRFCIAFDPVVSILACDYWFGGRCYRARVHAAHLVALDRLYVSATIALSDGTTCLTAMVTASWSIRDDPSGDGALWVQVLVLDANGEAVDQLFRIRESCPADLEP